MSKNSGSRKTILLGVLVVVVIIGICFVCVTLYAKNEINKEKFQMPEIDVPLLTQELTDKDKAFAYAMNQYNAAVSADNTEGRWRTDVRRLDEDWQTPFSKADNAILLGIRKKAGDQIKEMYPKQYGNVRLREVRDAIPPFVKQAQDVTDFSITLGRENDRNETVDTDRYFLTLTFDPNCEDTQAMLNSDAYQNICKELSPVAALNDTQIEMQSVSMSFWRRPPNPIRSEWSALPKRRQPVKGRKLPKRLLRATWNSGTFPSATCRRRLFSTVSRWT